MESDFEANQQLMAKIDPSYERKPFSEQSAKALYETRIEDILANDKDPAAEADDSDSFECDEDDPEREQKEAEWLEKRRERWLAAGRKLATEMAEESEDEKFIITEEELTEILEKVEETEFKTEEDAHKWFEA